MKYQYTVSVSFLEKSVKNKQNKQIWWIEENLIFYWIDISHKIYCKVASRSTSWLVARPGIFRLFVKGKFDPYVLWPLACDLWPLNSRPVYCSRLYGKLKFGEASRNQKRSICWKFQVSISLGTQKSAKIPPAVGKMIKPFHLSNLTNKNDDIFILPNMLCHFCTLDCQVR